MNRRVIQHGPGFSLLEAMVAVMILAIVAAVLAPVVSSVTEVYAASTSGRRVSERAGFAVERLVRFVRQAPPGAAGGTVGIATATATSIVLEDGSGIALSGDRIVLTNAEGETGVLCEDVESLELAFLGEDGVTSTLGAPGQTRRVNITLRSGGMTIVSAAFVRAGASL